MNTQGSMLLMQIIAKKLIEGNLICVEKIKPIILQKKYGGEEFTGLAIKNQSCLDFPLHITDRMFLSNDKLSQIITDIIMEMADGNYFDNTMIDRLLMNLLGNIGDENVSKLKFEPQKTGDLLDSPNRKFNILAEYSLVNDDSYNAKINNIEEGIKCFGELDENFKLVGKLKCGDSLNVDDEWFEDQVKNAIEGGLNSTIGELESQRNEGAEDIDARIAETEGLIDTFSFDLSDYI